MIVNLRQDVLSAYQKQADEIRRELAARGVCMVNLIGSPGSGIAIRLRRSWSGCWAVAR